MAATAPAAAKAILGSDPSWVEEVAEEESCRAQVITTEPVA
jgi:hypothetical protein